MQYRLHKTILASIEKVIGSFILRVNTVEDVSNGWCEHVPTEKETIIKPTGFALDKILPPVSHFDNGKRGESWKNPSYSLRSFSEWHKTHCKGDRRCRL